MALCAVYVLRLSFSAPFRSSGPLLQRCLKRTDVPCEGGPGKRKYQRNQTYAEYLHQPENLWNLLEPRQRQPGNSVFRSPVALCTSHLLNPSTVFRGTLGRGSWATQELPQVTTYSRKCEPSVIAPHSTKPSGDAENLFYPKCVFCGPPPPPPHVWQHHCSLSMPLPGGAYTVASACEMSESGSNSSRKHCCFFRVQVFRLCVRERG